MLESVNVRMWMSLRWPTKQTLNLLISLYFSVPVCCYPFRWITTTVLTKISQVLMPYMQTGFFLTRLGMTWASLTFRKTSACFVIEKYRIRERRMALSTLHEEQYWSLYSITLSIVKNYILLIRLILLGAASHRLNFLMVSMSVCLYIHPYIQPPIISSAYPRIHPFINPSRYLLKVAPIIKIKYKNISPSKTAAVFSVIRIFQADSRVDRFQQDD